MEWENDGKWTSGKEVPTPPAGGVRILGREKSLAMFCHHWVHDSENPLSLVDIILI